MIYKKIICYMLILIFLFSFSVQAIGDDIYFYVSLSGNDYNDGSYDSPYYTLYRARQAGRYLRENGFRGKIHIILKEGEYFLTSPLYLDSRDYNLIFDAEGKVSITGAISFNNDNASVLSSDDLLYSRFKKDVRDYIRCIDLSSINELDDIPEINDMFSDISDYIVSHDGIALTNARYPDEGMIIVKDVYKSGKEGYDNFIIGYEDENISSWKTPGEIYLEGYGSYLWAYQKIKLDSIDTANKKITSSYTKLYQGVYNGASVWFSNVLEELDNEGEWYIDRNNKKLYYYPANNGGEIKISVSKKSFLEIYNTHDITFSGITFENTRTQAVKINGCSRIVFDKCELINTGAEAINIKKSSSSGIKNSLIMQTGGGGIKFSQCGRKYDIKKSYNFVYNNEICDFSKNIPTYSPAVWIDGIGDIISHNTIHDSFHCGIIFYGNDNIISHNEIYNVLMGTEDAGAIYTYGDASARGNIIENNFIHHLGDGKRGFAGTGIFAVYFDNFNSGQTVRNNLFYDMPSGIHINGGGDNKIINNIFSDVEVPVYAHSFTSHDASAMWGGYLNLYKDEKIWEEKYPELSILPDPLHPTLSYRNNVVTNNIFSIYKNVGEEVISHKGTLSEKNTNTQTDIFSDVKNFDFSLKNTYQNFIPFDISSVGITN